VQADGKILAGGLFNGANSIGGQTRNFIARLDASTGAADSFDPNANSDVYTIAVQADGKILAGGFFNGANSIGGQTRNRIARLDATTGLDDSFDPNANGDVYSIAVQADGKILAGGSFMSIGGQTRSRIARLDATNGLADSFDPDANSDVYSIAVQADGKILAGGFFTSIGGQTRNRIARLNATTGLADSFDPNASNEVFSIAVQADGKILAGGFFTSIGGQSRSLFARLSNDTAALQNLAVTQTTITWTRGGSSPQFTRVTFEYSNDNVSYVPLGTGTASGSNWAVTGLSLPTGQNIYIRARGYYRSGYFNGSESITESVRNAFITLPPTPTAVVSTKIHGGTPFDINLPLTGSPGIECRTGGAPGNHQVIVTFAVPVTFTFAAVTSGTGSVASATGSGTTAVIVNLTGVANAQTITVTLFGVDDGTDTGNLGIPMGVLLGDVNSSRRTDSGDVTAVRNHTVSIPSDEQTARFDVNVSGRIDSGDVTATRNATVTVLPP
jgi:uncharacterized delta-60 repeat protein